MQIENLPDYPALQQLARALWHKGTSRGAAVLVGAGFSKNAERSAHDTPEPPTWRDFTRDMAAELYPNDRENVPSDPLRLAEEYRTYFGQAALDEFVRIRILEAAWQPGSLHHDLLSLQWSDVLTTNWDTLLERAADGVRHRHYDRVLSTSDLAHASAPRIVKLHGSLGMTEHFVVAEEDYRTYPAKFAAFVNFVRQVFIENELCLLGFSGDDPNFIRWSGWVRDNLGGSSRRIYLVGALDLSPAKRKFLEARNIAPVDLSPIVQDRPATARHADAMHRFLKFLAGAKPKPQHDWRPALIASYAFLPTTPHETALMHQDPNYGASLLERASIIWREERESYPGWLICPASRRDELQFSTAYMTISREILDALPDRNRSAIVYEIFWRYKTGLGQASELLIDFFERYADPATPNGLAREQRCDIAIFLLRRARQVADEEALNRWADIIEAQCEQDTDARAEVAYQKALYARDRLDFVAAAVHAASIKGVDPIWPAKRAALLAELGDFEQAEKLVTEAAAELNRRQSSDRGSLWLRSRRAWVEWLARAIRQDRLSGNVEPRWTSEFRDAHCDPEEEIDRLGNHAAAEWRQRHDNSKPTIPRFQAGHYQESAQTVQLQSTAFSRPLEELELVMEAAGLPMRLQHLTLLKSAAFDAADLAFEPSFRWYIWFLRATDGPLGALFGRYLGRVAVAQIPTEVAIALSDAMLRAIAYWRGKVKDTSSGNGLFAVAQLRLFIEVLARMTVRQKPLAARACLDLVSNLAQDASILHPWLWEPLDHLITYSIEAIPATERPAALLAMLEFPLCSDGRDLPFRWPNPITALWTTKPDRTVNDYRWNRCVAHLIEHAKAGIPQRPEAITRLAYLSKYDALTVDELQAFAEALWSATDEANGGLPANTNLLFSTFGQLPAPKTIDADDRVRAHLFDCDIKEILSPPGPLGSRDISNRFNHILAIAATAQVSLRPTADQAARLFDTIVDWRPTASAASDPIGASLLRPLRINVRRYLGDILRAVAVPCLHPADRTSERARALLAFLSEVPGSNAAAALPHFLQDDVDLQAEIIAGVQQAISARSDEEVAGGVMAIKEWAAQAAKGASPPLPPQFTDRLISALESRREIGIVSVLSGVRRLIVIGRVGESDRPRISRVLRELLTELQYERIDPESREAVSVSLVRAECVRLARALEDAGTSSPGSSGWLSAAPHDPLPEVRFALAAEE